MRAVGGTIREGKVVLDRPAEWPEGARVYVQLYREEDGLIEGVWPSDGFPSGEAEIQRRMEEGEKDVPSAEEADAFEAALKEVRALGPAGSGRAAGEVLMRRYLLDSGIAGDYLARRRGVYAEARSRQARGHVIGICVPVLGELWAGIELSATRDRNRRALLRDLPRWKVWPFDEAAAEEFGRVFAVLKRTGQLIQQVDMQVAAVALSLRNCTVVSKDTDFTRIPGLAVENWSIP